MKGVGSWVVLAWSEQSVVIERRLCNFLGYFIICIEGTWGRDVMFCRREVLSLVVLEEKVVADIKKT